MKLYCLSSDASKPCFVLSFRELLIMLDCGLSAHSVLNFLPLPPVPSTRLASLPNYTPPHLNDPLLEGELKECCGRVFVDSIPEFCPPLDKVVDFSQLDVILISNYTCMMALPFITEDTGFKGQVYATEPTLQIGRFYLEELAEWVSGAGGGGNVGAAKRWKELLHVLPPPLALASRPRSWRRLFSPASVARALSRVRVVGYDERVDIYGALDATAVSSGFCLGSANWVLRSAREKVAYVSGSSTLTTHPRPINQAALRGADLLILAALTQTPAHNPDHMLGDLCVHATVTLRGGGCVLCPVYPSGVLYDLLECLSAHLDGAGLQHVPLYVVSPVADSSLAYSNILAEWVSVGKQAKVYLPEEPFPHAALARAGRLRHAKHLHDDAFSAEFRQPCVVFCGHPSLRFGAAVHLVELWANNPAHAIIFTEPDFPHTEALAPFQPLSMKAFHCPIDTSLNYSQASKLVRELRPRELALPDQYAPPPAHHQHPAPRAHITTEVPTVVVRRGAARTCGVRRRSARAHLPASLAAAAATRAAPAPAPTPATTPASSLRLAPLTAALALRDNRLDLLPPPALPAAGTSNELFSSIDNCLSIVRNGCGYGPYVAALELLDSVGTATALLRLLLPPQPQHAPTPTPATSLRLTPLTAALALRDNRLDLLPPPALPAAGTSNGKSASLGRAAPAPTPATSLRLAPLTAALALRDNRLDLLPPPALPAAGTSNDAETARVHWGALDVESFVVALAREGITEARVEGDIVHLPRHDTLVQIERHATHVFCEGRADVRQALRRALAACLPHV